MKHLKRDLLIVVCGILACVAAARSQQLPDAPSATPHTKLLTPVEWQPTHRHLKFITNHPTRTAILGIAGAMVAAFFIKPTPHCHHYEYGHNGVDVPCPVETSGK